MFKLTYSSHFRRRAEIFRRQHPELRDRLARVLRDLQQDPYQQRLRLHALRGEFEGQHAVSITQQYRIRLILVVKDNEIELLRIGTHDDVY